MENYKFEIGQKVWAYSSFADQCQGTIIERISLNPRILNKEKRLSYIEIPVPICDIQYLLDDGIWYPETTIHQNSMENSEEAVCSKNGCELIDNFLEKNIIKIFIAEICIPKRIDGCIFVEYEAISYHSTYKKAENALLLYLTNQKINAFKEQYQQLKEEKLLINEITEGTETFIKHLDANIYNPCYYQEDSISNFYKFFKHPLRRIREIEVDELNNIL